MDTTISVIIPAKDEEKHIGNLISSVRKIMPPLECQVIVVDDGSADNTRQIALDGGAEVFSFPHNRGKGAAMMKGAEMAKGSILVFLDGDGAHDPIDIPLVAQPILENRADLVIGSRSLAGSQISAGPFRRRMANTLASRVVSVVTEILLPTARLANRLSHPGRKRSQRTPDPRRSKRWISDCTSGFRAIKKEIWNGMVFTRPGFEIETEMIYEAARLGVVLTEVPIHCVWDSRASHLSIWRDGFKTCTLLAGRLFNEAWK